MLRRIGRLFTIKTRFEAIVVIYALALGAVERGAHYRETYPGIGGWLLSAACTGAVFLAGAKLMELTRKDNGERRRRDDFDSAPRSGNYILDVLAPLRVERGHEHHRPDLQRREAGPRTP